MSLSSDGRAKDANVPRFENLEERLMLTTVYGGQVVEYVQPLDAEVDLESPLEDATIVRIALQGDIVAELIGIDLLGNVGHVPLDVLGGGALQGLSLIHI